LRFIVPEVLQTSAMDCGPAALKALLEGIGVRVSYQRLREACLTQADGTSIDALEDLAIALGLEAFQELAPIEDAFDVLAKRAPCIVVVQASGAPHFVLLWRVDAGWAQLMDPGKGRRFVRRDELLRELFVHQQRFEPGDFWDWWVTTAWFGVAQARAQRLSLTDQLTSTRDPERAGMIEAAARIVERLVRRRVVPSKDAATIVDELTNSQLLRIDDLLIPAAQIAISTDTEQNTTAKGCVFLSVRGGDVRAADGDSTFNRVLGDDDPSPTKILFRLMSKRGKALLVNLSLLSGLMAVVAVAEMLFLRAAFNATTLLALAHQRLVACFLYALLVVLTVALEGALGFGILRLGRDLELRTRIALSAKLAKVPDRYFRSHPIVDTLHRVQHLFELKALPEIAAAFARSTLEFLVTCGALCVIYPHGTGWVLGALLCGAVAPYLLTRIRQQVEARRQIHYVSLWRLYLDALQGLLPLRVHGGQISLRARQDEHLYEWRRQARSAVLLLSVGEALQSLAVLACVVCLVLGFLQRSEDAATLLLLVFWAVRLPIHARGISTSLQHFPNARAAVARLVEPLTAEANGPTAQPSPVADLGSEPQLGLAIELRDVSASIGAQNVLSEMHVTLHPGSRVAVVGSSGAGKSSLVAVLLGLLECQGELLLDGVSLESYGVSRLRRETVWIDPAVQLWSRTLLENVRFGNPQGARHSLRSVIEQAELGDLIERLTNGLATELGEGGVRVSGGEGQRVRVARGLMRQRARLVLLDEAFRGLDRSMRRRLSDMLRNENPQASILEVTHDIADTFAFDQILVIEDGRLIEVGRPAELLSLVGSRYAELARADAAAQHSVWAGSAWRRFAIGSTGALERLDADG
jgi:ABC-type bacteriocin/lantibiotic exporter with double-glycine peptidase domain